MRFCDSSALIPLLIREKSSDAMRTILISDRHIAASVITPVEIESALHAIQLATAIVAAGSTRVPLAFVTLDLDLADAARAEGFDILP